MSSKFVRILPIVALAIITACQLIYSASILADNDKAEDTVADVAVSEQPGVNVDSLYAIIQQDFTKLESIWQKACYDCHTDKTVYPWYYKLPFVKGMIDKDIEEARAELDMSKGFPFVSQRKPVDDLRKLAAEVEEGAMPPGKYTIIHWGASLSQEEKDSVAAFVDNSLKMLAGHGITPTPRKPRPEGS